MISGGGNRALLIRGGKLRGKGMFRKNKDEEIEKLLDEQDYRTEIDGAFDRAVAALDLSEAASDEIHERKAGQDRWDRSYDALG